MVHISYSFRFGNRKGISNTQDSISDVVQLEWKASSIGVYRFWRDIGCAFGALFEGLLTDTLNVNRVGHWFSSAITIYSIK